MVICPLVDVRKLAMANQCFDSCVALKEVPALNFTNIIKNSEHSTFPDMCHHQIKL